jgi:biopolymer transport protein ExbD
MKFPRNARIFRGQLDMAPFAAVFFLLVLFLMLGTRVYTPGAHVQLPAANDLPGTDKASVSVAMDAKGHFYFENQLIEEKDLRNRLRQTVGSSAGPLTLVAQMDKDATIDMWTRLALLAREAGIAEVVQATLPGVSTQPALAPPP